MINLMCVLDRSCNAHPELTFWHSKLMGVLSRCQKPANIEYCYICAMSVRVTAWWFCHKMTSSVFMYLRLYVPEATQNHFTEETSSQEVIIDIPEYKLSVSLLYFCVYLHLIRLLAAFSYSLSVSFQQEPELCQFVHFCWTVTAICTVCWLQSEHGIRIKLWTLCKCTTKLIYIKMNKTDFIL